MKHRRWKIALLLAGVTAGVLAGLRGWVASRFTPERFAAFLEETRNCRASAGSTAVRLLAFPAKLEVNHLKVWPRDESRKPATPGETAIEVRELVLEVNLWSLLWGELDIHRAMADGVSMRTVKWLEGGNSLQLLLAEPGTEARPSLPPVTLEDADEIPAPDEPAAGSERPFHISELPVSASLREARIRNATWSITNHRKRTVQEFRDCDFVLTGMTLDPDNPPEGGSARVSARTRMTIDSQRLNLRTIDFLLSLDGDYQLIDPATGNLNNDLDFQLTVNRGSLLNRIPTLVKLNEQLEKLKSSIGLDIRFPAEASLTADAPVRAHLKDGVIRLRDDVLFPFDNYQLSLERSGWLSLRDETHLFAGRLVVTGETSQNAVSGLRTFLEEQSGTLANLVSKTLLERVVTKTGDIELPFESSEQIGRPNVRLSGKLTDALKRSAAEAGRDLLKDAIEGGDDLNSIIDAVKDFRRKGE